MMSNYFQLTLSADAAMRRTQTVQCKTVKYLLYCGVHLTETNTVMNVKCYR